MNILIIEDDKDLCHGVSYQLTQAGHRVDCCHDGGEAALYIRQGIYDLVLLDLCCPVKTVFTSCAPCGPKEI